ncbi:DEAD/DEAH box helicase [Texcoconibacillus texcoconensis]|uniref:Competence protein ComFA n=1 Tax=Texcoconibacillus texcoconensis TaxID=1095777 RepID=A0A840QR46_9BACI|nr:DEAD/DEAH box helicase [Texcoconibacillus texcoconensis]MBB5173767.1 competence protein ComFA [Texcoconibacillus texcoconensis]
MLFVLEQNWLVPVTENDPPANAQPLSAFTNHTIQWPQPDRNFSFNTELQQILTMRRLTTDEINHSISTLYDHARNGYVRFEAGITFSASGRPHCVRCDNTDPTRFASFSCARCGQECTYCRRCITMGRVSACTPLWTWHGPETQPDSANPHTLAWEGTLSPFQQQASDKLVARLHEATAGEFLLWAVCGAGKTEMLFPAIERALALGKRVLIATPRTDVVLELAPRLNEAFPEAEVIALYGGSEDRFKQGQLVVSTTHQLLRYKDAFSFVIIDEVDAFPYSADAMLHFAVQEARTPDAETVYLTATPSPDMKTRARTGRLPYVTVPRRYHGFDLPVPSFRWCGNWRTSLQRAQIPTTVSTWLRPYVDQDVPVFLFLPSIVLLEQILPTFQQQYPSVDGVHAEDAERKEKVQAFRDGTTKVLLTTTILERGVTVPGSQVAVVGADAPVFTEAALVQIAGRAGRKASDPNADVIYFHYGITREMAAAKRHIEAMNESKM